MVALSHVARSLVSHVALSLVVLSTALALRSKKYNKKREKRSGKKEKMNMSSVQKETMSCHAVVHMVEDRGCEWRCVESQS